VEDSEGWREGEREGGREGGGGWMGSARTVVEGVEDSRVQHPV
jgi:hypothetical protein